MKHLSLYEKFNRCAMVTVIGAGLVVPQIASACTSFLIHTTDGGSVYGRTMEFAVELKSQALVIPRNYDLSSSGPDGKPGMKWASKYAAVGLNALGVEALLDGINEKGLTGGMLYFADFAKYTDPADADPSKSLAPWEFLTWALTNFATVEEVKAALADITIIDLVQSDMGFTPPLHYTLHDATGASLVIEPIDGKLIVYDNPFGVMTNSPTFDWHLTNLRNYIKISAVDAPPLKIGNEILTPLGQGSGLLGIPGDPTPPSRFLRAMGYAMLVEKKPGGMESVQLAEHIVNNFDIPKGWIRVSDDSKEPLEYTQWSSVADLQNLIYYVKTYDNQTLRSIDLKSFDLDAKVIMKAPLDPSGPAPALEFTKP